MRHRSLAIPGRRWAWALGLGVVALALLPPRTPPGASCTRTAAGAPLDHLGRCERGTHVTVTSVDRTRGHELLLIDGELHDRRYHWRSSARDERPRIALVFDSPRVVTGLALHRARDGDEPGPLDVVARARTPDGWRPLGTLRADTRGVARLRVKPIEVVGLEIDLSSPDARRVGLREIEVLGPLPEAR